jgi:tetratricopeptide (TPR) repeat protein
MGMLAAMRARLDEATELVVRSRAVMNDAGSQWIWIVTFWYAFISVWQGNPAEAEQELLPAYEALKKMGEKSHFSSITHALSNVLYLQGRYDEAEQLTRECEAVTRPNDIHSGILWRSIRSKILARRGEFEAAEQLAQEALAIASTSDFHIAHADALLDLAEVLALTGNPDATPALIRQAKGLYELKGNVLAAERAGSHLQNLDETPGQAEVT